MSEEVGFYIVSRNGVDDFLLQLDELDSAGECK
jgi:hypothetical protein